jgi:hypothetical protein
VSTCAIRHRAAGTLRDDVRVEDIVAAIVGMFAATSRVGGDEQGLDASLGKE